MRDFAQRGGVRTARTSAALLLADATNPLDNAGHAIALIEQQYTELLGGSRLRTGPILAKYSHAFRDLAAKAADSAARKRTARLAQEMTDAARVLPCSSTHAMFVCVDETKCHVLKVLLTGVHGTPYAGGCYEFDVYCPPEYPDVAPKVQLVTTGNGSIRFNPNLYANGKVCLSLLGTWAGKGGETWSAASTLLQVYSSIQSLVMSDEVYFNEPGFENAVGTPDGVRLNQGYANIVRFGNVKYAILGQLLNPSPAFASVIR